MKPIICSRECGSPKRRKSRKFRTTSHVRVGIWYLAASRPKESYVLGCCVSRRKSRTISNRKLCSLIRVLHVSSFILAPPRLQASINDLTLSWHTPSTSTNQGYMVLTTAIRSSWETCRRSSFRISGARSVAYMCQ